MRATSRSLSPTSLYYDIPQTSHDETHFTSVTLAEAKSGLCSLLLSHPCQLLWVFIFCCLATHFSSLLGCFATYPWRSLFIYEFGCLVLRLRTLLVFLSYIWFCFVCAKTGKHFRGRTWLSEVVRLRSEATRPTPQNRPQPRMNSRISPKSPRTCSTSLTPDRTCLTPRLGCHTQILILQVCAYVSSIHVTHGYIASLCCHVTEAVTFSYKRV